MQMYQAHKLHENIHDIELSTMDAKTVGEVKRLLLSALPFYVYNVCRGGQIKRGQLSFWLQQLNASIKFNDFWYVWTT